LTKKRKTASLVAVLADRSEAHKQKTISSDVINRLHFFPGCSGSKIADGNPSAVDASPDRSKGQQKAPVRG
jgi:hypothetical protein